MKNILIEILSEGFYIDLTLVKRVHRHDVYNARMAETYLATANYVWPAAVDTLALVKT